jgi:hypothetical protein
MSSSRRGLRIGIQAFLGVAIVVLTYWLYVSITEPYQVIAHQQELTRLTRHRMNDIRTGMIQYQQRHNRFPRELDSLVMFIRQDPVLSTRADSVFGPNFELDSLIYSPRSGRQFLLSVNDTARVHTYLLEDPDSRDYIGTLLPDVTLLNAASWE